MNLEKQFVDAAVRGTNAADTDVVSYWLRDADAAPVDPHFATRLLRAVLADHPTNAHHIALDWLGAAALAFAQNEEAKAAERGSLEESPIEAIKAMRGEP